MNNIRILATGGTIGGYFQPDEPQRSFLIPILLARAHANLPVMCEEVFAKDSRAITAEDRDLLLARCRSCAEEKIIITHGTYTLIETAQYLEKFGLKKIIILVGATLPNEKAEWNGLFNLGAAATAVQLQPYGVYITMNGRIFSPGNIRKNPETGDFEEIGS